MLEDWDPFHDLIRLRKRFDELFERGFQSELVSDEGTEKHWTPAVDMYEGDGRIVIMTELPGVEVGDIEVEFSSGRLIIRGQRPLVSEADKAVFHRIERWRGPFRRVFPLGGQIDVDGIQARLHNGILRVEVPMRGESRDRKIEVVGQ
ncbi:MAG: Hsp20/alpha crystallin family protein [Deltaproteobacteria bacterium]|nr:Hsp20/alpha crystallin family protein [Deltaproteobacteria bacterium]